MSKVETYQQEIRDAIEYFDEMMPYMVGDRGMPHFETARKMLRAQIEPGELMDVTDAEFRQYRTDPLPLSDSESIQSGAIRSARGDAE